MISMTLDDFLGPQAEQPDDVKCDKCWAMCPCVRWEEYPFGPFKSNKPNLYKCPSHGYFEVEGGKQVFDTADCWVTGPDGRPMRLFEPGE